MKAVLKIGHSEELNSSQAVLLMEVGETHFAYAVMDYANQMLVQLAYYAREEDDDEDLLKKMIENDAALKESFRHTAVCYYLKENVLIPSKYYQYENTQTLLRSLYERGNYAVVTESVSEWHIYNAYNVPSTVHSLIGRNYATGNFWHAHSVILKNKIENHDLGKLLVDFKTDSFSVVAIKNNTLLIAQIFPYTKAEDVLYWLLKICEQHSISQNQARLLLSGLIDKQSVVLKELYQYFLNIDFAPIENDIRLSDDFEEYPAHYFSSFYKLALCVS